MKRLAVHPSKKEEFFQHIYFTSKDVDGTNDVIFDAEHPVLSHRSSLPL